MKFIRRIIPKIILLCILTYQGLQSFGQGYEVLSFSADITISTEGYFDITEKYKIHHREKSHGIYRDIVTLYPIKKPDGKEEKRKIKISKIKVEGGPFKKTEKSGILQIRIRDEKKFVEGQKEYTISYRVKNALLSVDSIQQFYWNIKPSDWTTDFKQIHFTIHFPGREVPEPGGCFVYAGADGRNGLSDEFEYQYSDSTFSGQSKNGFKSASGENVTVLINLPEVVVNDNNEPLSWWIKYSWVGFLALIIWLVRKLWKGLTYKEKVTAVTTYYPPEGMDPALAGYLIDNSIDKKDLVSLFPYWAMKGWISIKEIPRGGKWGRGDVELTKLTNIAEDAAGYEIEIFNGVFRSEDKVLISQLGESFSTALQNGKRRLEVKARSYYDTKNDKSLARGCFQILIPVLVGVALGVAGGYIALIAGVVLYIILIPYLSKKKNEKGKKVLSELLGFREFIKKADADRIQTLLREDTGYFEKTLSYAVAFGLLKEWTGKFSSLEVSSPEWYSGTDDIGDISTFSRSFNDSLSIARTAMVEVPTPGESADGGGSSGGGFGSGGGGTW